MTRTDISAKADPDTTYVLICFDPKADEQRKKLRKLRGLA